jgi:hypothetical protein
MVKIMSVIKTVAVMLLQFLVGQLLGFGGAMAAGVGNGWELLVMPVGNIAAIFGIGALALRLGGEVRARPYVIRLVGTAVGSFLGVILILVTPATGFNQVLYPLLGAMLGYYLLPRVYE